MSITCVVLVQSPEPEAHDMKCLVIIKIELEFGNVNF